MKKYIILYFLAFFTILTTVNVQAFTSKGYYVKSGHPYNKTSSCFTTYDLACKSIGGTLQTSGTYAGHCGTVGSRICTMSYENATCSNGQCTCNPLYEADYSHSTGWSCNLATGHVAGLLGLTALSVGSSSTCLATGSTFMIGCTLALTSGSAALAILADLKNGDDGSDIVIPQNTSAPIKVTLTPKAGNNGVSATFVENGVTQTDTSASTGWAANPDYNAHTYVDADIKGTTVTSHGQQGGINSSGGAGGGSLAGGFGSDSNEFVLSPTDTTYYVEEQEDDLLVTKIEPAKQDGEEGVSITTAEIETDIDGGLNVFVTEEEFCNLNCINVFNGNDTNFQPTNKTTYYDDEEGYQDCVNAGGLVRPYLLYMTADPNGPSARYTCTYQNTTNTDGGGTNSGGTDGCADCGTGPGTTGGTDGGGTDGGGTTVDGYSYNDGDCTSPENVSISAATDHFQNCQPSSACTLNSYQINDNQITLNYNVSYGQNNPYTATKSLTPCTYTDGGGTDGGGTDGGGTDGGGTDGGGTDGGGTDGGGTDGGGTDGGGTDGGGTDGGGTDGGGTDGGGTDGGGTGGEGEVEGGGDCNKEPQKCFILTNIMNAVTGEGTDAQVVLDKLDKDEDINNYGETAQAILDDFFQSDLYANEFLTAINDAPNPYTYLGGKAGNCSYTFQMAGAGYELSLCDHMTPIHSAVAFGIFLFVFFEIKELLLEKA